MATVSSDVLDERATAELLLNAAQNRNKGMVLSSPLGNLLYTLWWWGWCVSVAVVAVVVVVEEHSVEQDVL